MPSHCRRRARPSAARCRQACRLTPRAHRLPRGPGWHGWLGWQVVLLPWLLPSGEAGLQASSPRQGCFSRWRRSDLFFAANLAQRVWRSDSCSAMVPPCFRVEACPPLSPEADVPASAWHALRRRLDGSLALIVALILPAGLAMSLDTSLAEHPASRRGRSLSITPCRRQVPAFHRIGAASRWLHAGGPCIHYLVGGSGL